MTPVKPRRKLPWWVRWLHTYVSLAGFGALIFFALTGLTLNHAEWFEGVETTEERVGRAPAAMMASDVGVAAGIELLAWLQRAEQLDGHPSSPVDDGGELTVTFEGAGYMADVVIQRDSGEYLVIETRRGLFAIMNDLHKGRHTSFAWGLLIDVSAVALALSGATGIWLLWFLKRVRLKGMLVAALGSVALLFVYLCWQ